MNELLLIDANSLIHRCFHALPPLSSPTGDSTNALYGMANILARIVLGEKPKYAAALFDRPEPTFRKKEYSAYKAHRPKAPDELISQIIEAHNLFNAFGIKTFESPGWEADDLIATLVKKFKNLENLKITILTGDLDALQLVDGELVAVRTFRKGINDTFTYTPKEVFERYGVNPEQMVDYKTMVGDPSDNIPGISGIGPKTAANILQKNKSIASAILNSPHEKGVEKLAADQELVALNQSLAALREWKEIPIKDIEEILVTGDAEKMKIYCIEKGFKSLEKRLSGTFKETGGIGGKKTNKKQPPPSNQGSFF